MDSLTDPVDENGDSFFDVDAIKSALQPYSAPQPEPMPWVGYNWSPNLSALAGVIGYAKNGWTPSAAAPGYMSADQASAGFYTLDVERNLAPMYELGSSKPHYPEFRRVLVGKDGVRVDAPRPVARGYFRRADDRWQAIGRYDTPDIIKADRDHRPFVDLAIRPDHGYCSDRMIVGVVPTDFGFELQFRASPVQLLGAVDASNLYKMSSRAACPFGASPEWSNFRLRVPGGHAELASVARELRDPYPTFLEGGDGHYRSFRYAWPDRLAYGRPLWRVDRSNWGPTPSASLTWGNSMLMGQAWKISWQASLTNWYPPVLMFSDFGEAFEPAEPQTTAPVTPLPISSLPPELQADTAVQKRLIRL